MIITLNKDDKLLFHKTLIVDKLLISNKGYLNDKDIERLKININPDIFDEVIAELEKEGKITIEK